MPGESAQARAVEGESADACSPTTAFRNSASAHSGRKKAPDRLIFAIATYPLI